MGNERICPVCGKRFIRPMGTIYSIKYNRKTWTCCGWNCYNEALKHKDKYLTRDKPIK